MADQLCTTAQVKARAQITDAGDDAVISLLIDGVSDWIEDRARRKLVPDNAATYLFDTSEGSIIYVRRGIRSITSLEVATSDQPDTGGTYTTLAASEYTLRPLPAELRVGWPPDTVIIRGSSPRLRAALNAARITGNFGFAATPPGIIEVAIDAVVAALATRGDAAAQVIGASGVAVFPWSTYFGEGTAQLATVEGYRGIGGIG